MLFIANGPIMGKNIAYLRDKSKMSRDELCRRTGICWDALCRIEEGESFDIEAEHLIKICEIFNVDMDALVKIDFEIHKK